MTEQITAYMSAMAQARQMMRQGLITRREYADIDTIMLQKYGLSSVSLFRDIDLIFAGGGANMSHD